MAQATRVRRFGGHPAGRGHHFSGADLLLHARHLRSRHHAAAILAIAVLVVASIQVFPSRAVTVISDGQAHEVTASFDTDSASLANASIALAPGDQVLAGGEGSHLSLAVVRATPIEVDVDGTVLSFNTRARTIQGALAEAGVELRDGDRVLSEGRVTAPRAPLSAVVFAARPGSTSVLRSGAGIGDTQAHFTVVRARPVTVYVDKLPVETSSAAATVGGVLGDLGLTVREGDLVQPALEAPVSAGMTIWLAKAATVKVTLNGVDQILYTQAETVNDVLQVLGITLREGDVLSPEGSTPLRSDMSIVIGTTEVRTEEVNETIPAPVRYETDDTMPVGTVKVIPGRDGLRVRKEEVTFRNGVELSRVVLGGGVVEEATPSRHIMGSLQTGGTNPTLSAPDYTGAYSWKLFAKVTWYNASHGGRPASDPNYGMTATGVFVDYGICAVDPTVIPLGTRMYIPGYGQCLAADTGGGVKGNLVDLGFPESAGNNPWGTKNMDVYILD